MIDYLARIWIKNISPSFTQPFSLSFYGGEPLLNMQLIEEVISYVEGLGNIGKKFHYNMTTNGLLLNRFVDYLVNKNFNLLISIDGNQQGHSYRVDKKGGNSHERVVKNIKLLQENYSDYYKKHVRFNTVLHNKNSVESAYSYIKDNFNKETTVSSLNNSGIKENKLNEFYKTYQNVSDSINKAKNCESLEAEMFIKAPRISQLATFLHGFSGNVFDSYTDLLINPDKLLSPPTGTCTPFSKKMFVTTNGKILQCEKVNHEFALGQVQDNKLDLELQLIADKFNDNVFRYIRQCSICAIQDKCKQCVFQIDDINAPGTKCRSYTSPEAHKRYIQKQLDYLGRHPELYDKILKRVVITN